MPEAAENICVVLFKDKMGEQLNFPTRFAVMPVAGDEIHTRFGGVEYRLRVATRRFLNPEDPPQASIVLHCERI